MGTENNGMNQVKGLKRVWEESSTGEGPRVGTHSTAAAGGGGERRRQTRDKGAPGHTGPGGAFIVPGLHPRPNGKPLKRLASQEHGTTQCGW